MKQEGSIMFKSTRGNNDINYEVVNVDPKLANKWLIESNLSNRRLRPSHVKHLADQMLQDRWKLSPEPIVFNKTGLLLDGQHRLSAIVKSGVNQDMVVAIVEDTDVYKVLDQGVNRTNSDITGLHPSVVGPIQYLLRATGTMKPVPEDIEELRGSNLLQSAEYIHEVIKPKDRRFKMMPFRAAFCVATGSNKANVSRCIEIYTDLGCMNLHKFTPIMKDIFRQFDDGFEKQDGRSLNNEFFMRGMYLFLNTDTNRSTLRLHDGFRKKVSLMTRELMLTWKSGSN